MHNSSPEHSSHMTHTGVIHNPASIGLSMQALLFLSRREGSPPFLSLLRTPLRTLHCKAVEKANDLCTVQGYYRCMSIKNSG